ncbi:MAG: radical SAM protein [Candidatus Methylomirabilis oxygeniifera]|uniref:Radical SAM domain protein n=1 Tax=Methylomirabilis oxygeniifera TaxID=671143 RepID=D5MKN9_METO1|nr:MAG: radical SAM protein [Candidatus Methylomirabilis oxyfera]CBE67686.1 Radical SAM domain protein [Candidatus Methylomirabilis oxyfera]
MAFAVGIGLTNECNLTCPHCYRPDTVISRLTREDMTRICESIPVRSINLGVGENGLHPDFHVILADLERRSITTSITSNGLSLQVLCDEELKRFHSVEISLDFPTRQEHDTLRGEGNWRAVIKTLERCSGLGLNVTVTSVMMNVNSKKLPALAKLAASLGAYLRVNVYQPSKSNYFTLSYHEFWDGFKRLLGSARLAATTEPVLAGVLGLDGFVGPACGRSTIRVAPDGRVLPCTYWPSSRLTLDDLYRQREQIIDAEEFQQARTVPAACRGCPCGGGCAGRRALVSLHDPDPYCPFARGDKIAIDWERAGAEDLPKAGSACTTIVSAR